MGAKTLKPWAAELQDEARDFVEFAQLSQRLESFDFYFTGSYALDLMAWPDVDVNVRFAGHHQSIFALGSEILKELSPSWFELRHAANEKDSPGIYFLGFEIRHHSILWNVDIWFLDDDRFMANQDWLRTTYEAMTPKRRDSIVAIKQSLLARGVYPTERSSMDVYTAVLDGGVHDVEEFNAWVEHSRAGIQ